MKSISLKSLLVLFLTLGNLNAQSPVVTIYNSNFGVISESRKIDFTKGKQELLLTDVPSEIVAESVRLDFGGKVVEQSFLYDLLNVSEILNRYIGKEIQLKKSGNEMLSGKLLSVAGNQLVLESNGGGLVIVPEFNTYTIQVVQMPDGFVAKPTLKWLVDVEKPGSQNVNLTYQTNAMTWSADYTLTINEQENLADIEAWASITNQSGKKYEDATINLIAGKVKRLNRNISNLKSHQIKINGIDSRASFDGGEGIEIDYEPLNESIYNSNFGNYFLYILNQKTTINNNETKRVNLFESSAINVKKEYFISFSSNIRSDEPLDNTIVYKIKNSKENNLGLLFPKGIVAVYQNQNEKTFLIGETSTNIVPIGNELIVNIGESPNIIAKSKMLNSEKKYDSENWYSINKYRITISNKKDEDNIGSNLIVYLGYSEGKILECSHKYEFIDQNNVKINFDLSNKKDEIIELTIKQRN